MSAPTPASRVVVDMPAVTALTVRCPVCGEEHWLFWSGGELSQWVHHGHRFALEHGPIYLAHYTDHVDDDDDAD